MTRALALAISALLAGCATTPPLYNRPNTTVADFERDKAACEYEAASSTANYGSGQNTSRTMGGAIAQGIGIGLGRAMETSNLVAMCLRARGYYRCEAEGCRAVAATAAAVPVEYIRMPDLAPPPRTAAAPAVAASLPGESKWMIVAEGVARASSCSPPATAMTSKGAGMEMFAVACPNGTTMAIRCEVDGCRVLR
jgi:hypothetical protein